MKSLSTKKIIIAILSALFAFCMIAGLTANKVSANTDLERVSLSTTMEQSAQMRLTNPTGMRFIIDVSEEDVALFGDDIQVVTMITQKNLLDDANIDVADFNKDSAVKMATVEFNKYNLEDAMTAHGSYKLTATILEISDANIAKTYVAKTYITDGEKIGYVEQVTEASIYNVATEALKTVNPAEEPENYEVLLGYTKSCNIVINGNVEEPVKVPYGSKLTDTIFYGMPECLTVVSIKDANSNDVAKDFVVTEDIALTIELAENHVWKDGKCEFDCGAKCNHPEYENGACVDCGTVCEHSSYIDGTCTVCGTVCSHEWDGNACKICGLTINFVDYDKAVYLQYDGKVEGLDYNGVAIINNVNATITDGVVDSTAMEALNAALTLGQDVEILIPSQTEYTVIKATAKYVTLAISNYEELTHIDDNLGTNYFILANDIDCSGNEWINERNNFYSTLDGNGYVIKNLLIAHEKSGQHNGYSDNSFVGTSGWNAKFITNIGNGGVVKNVVFDNVSFKGNSSVITKTAFIGASEGIVENVVMSIGSPDCDGFGGLVGSNSGTIKNCALDYSRQVQWTMGYISTVNNGTIENVSVNIPSVFTIDQFKLIGTDNGSSTNCVQLAKTQREMYSYITDSTLKALYGKITFEAVSALTEGTKQAIDFNGKTVNGYVVNKAYGTTFGFTNDYIADLKMRNIVGVKVWAKCSGHLYMPPKTEGALGGSDRTDWQDYSTWKAINIGRNFSQESNDTMPSAYYNRVLADTVITPDQLALFDIGCAVQPNDNIYIYIEEFTSDNVPVISGKEYTTKTETIGEQVVTVYRVEFNSNNSKVDQNNAISGFMLSDGYLDKLASEGYTSITLMVKTDGLINTSLGYRIGDDNWRADWRNGSVLSDWTEINNTVTSSPYTIAEAKILHINGLEGNGLPYPTYVEFYIVAHK